MDCEGKAGAQYLAHAQQARIDAALAECARLREEADESMRRGGLYNNGMVKAREVADHIERILKGGEGGDDAQT